VKMNARSLVKAFVPLPGQTMAVYTSSGLDHYQHPDWLGNERYRSYYYTTNYHQSCTNLPFGDALSCSAVGGGVTSTYAYDGNGIRVKKTFSGATTVYISSSSKVIAEYVSGAAASSPSKEYIYAGSQLLATIAGGTTSYHIADPLSARVTTDANGTVTGQQGHYPFGEQWYPAPPSSAATKWQFTSYERDPESQNDYAIARTYVNRLGRFSSPDPLAGSLADPQSLNRYAYTENDPTNLVDPLGLRYCPLAHDQSNCSFDSFILGLFPFGGTLYFSTGLSTDPEGPDMTFGDAMGIMWLDMQLTGGSSGKAPLSTKDQGRYEKLKSKALNNIFNPDCISFLISRGIDPVEFASTVFIQNAYNGSKSAITLADAGVGMPGTRPGDSIATGFKQPGVHAAASITVPDVYFHQGGFLSGWFGNGYIRESTIEHEGLHNYLKIGDYGPGGLKDRLGLDPYTQGTTDINDALKAHHCTN
jgi:RHS repeat-associated protein